MISARLQGIERCSGCDYAIADGTSTSISPNPNNDRLREELHHRISNSGNEVDVWFQRRFSPRNTFVKRVDASNRLDPLHIVIRYMNILSSKDMLTNRRLIVSWLQSEKPCLSFDYFRSPVSVMCNTNVDLLCSFADWIYASGHWNVSPLMLRLILLSFRIVNQFAITVQHTLGKVHFPLTLSFFSLIWSQTAPDRSIRSRS